LRVGLMEACPFVCHGALGGRCCGEEMHSRDDISYALETTSILYEPDRRIDTFGTTRFEFQLMSELMDRVGQVRVRVGEVEANRPAIIRPEGYEEVDFEGFGENARRLYDWMRDQGTELALLRYGFQFRRGEVREELVHESVDAVRHRLIEEAREVGNPMMAVIEGVDDAWEISVLRFAFEMVQKSHGINVFDFKRKGML